MSRADTTRVVLGVAGGIAAYKSPDLVRRLREHNAQVRVVLTHGARQFVTPLTFQAVSGQPVHSDLLDDRAEAAMGHIELARWAEVVLVAPATAHVLAKLAHGLADDLLSTLCLATTAPLFLAPAMNQQMWQAAAVQANAAALEGRGVTLLGPGSGDQACGETGAGRMLEPAAIAAAVLAPPAPALLAGLGVLVTAGPTREAIDPVRYITNHSSGKMGYAVAAAARAAGARVTLVSGPTGLAPPAGVDVVAVESAAQMHEAVLGRVAAHELFIASAAVADYRPAAYVAEKIKKGDGDRTLALARTRDILADVAGRTSPPFTVGFAAETTNVEAHALEKLERKRIDMIAANRVGQPGSGFGADDNALTVYWRGGRRELPLASKASLARALIEIVAENYYAQHPAQDS